MRLPSDFLLGVSTSAWQIEGASDQRGRCIWDEFSEKPGIVVDGSTADPACDHVARLDEDLDWLDWLGVDTYSFTIAWTRVLPDGVGTISVEGLAFYDRLVDGLLERGISPTATLFHWDGPASMSWTDRSTAEAFGEYAQLVAENLADRVDRWATMNEPWCQAFLGYAMGIHAPGVQDAPGSLAAAHHLLVAHANGIAALRSAGARNVGTVLNLMPVIAESPDAEATATHIDGIQNRLFLLPLAGRGIPDDVIAHTAHLTDWGFVRDGDLESIAEPIDWLGVNYYTPMRVRIAESGTDEAIGQDVSGFPGADRLAPGPVDFAPREPRTAMGWEISPAHLTETLEMTARWLPDTPLYVNENGAAFDDAPDVDGVVDDESRVDYLREHLEATMAARDAEIDVRGYFIWSFLDNLEWAEGRTKRFGLLRVDPDTLDRTPKASALWLREVCRNRVM